MAADRKQVVKELLRRHGRTFADEVGIDVSSGSPSVMFRLLVFAMLAGARIRSSAAVEAAKALTDAGWTSAKAMLDAPWKERVRVLNKQGYARYDERTAGMLGDASGYLLDRYGGDLRRMRDEAGREPRREREMLQWIKGIGPVSADIFLREAQAVWDELVPYVDERTRKAAGALGLPTCPDELAGLVGREDTPRLVAALIRSSLEHDADEIVDAVARRYGMMSTACDRPVRSAPRMVGRRRGDYGR